MTFDDPHTALTPAQHLGNRGELLVRQWLETQGWRILAQKWTCRHGEIDLVAAYPQRGAIDRLAFVEVKTRSQGNWDANGALAITAQKQEKLWKTAELFLLKHPTLADRPCQFDVALVAVKASHLVIQEYIAAAFGQ